MLDTGRRKITRDAGEPIYLVLIDEYAYFSATVGELKEQKQFAALSRDLVARGRAAGVIVILATQRPSHQIIDPSLRDLFSYRCEPAGIDGAHGPQQPSRSVDLPSRHYRTPAGARRHSRHANRVHGVRTGLQSAPIWHGCGTQRARRWRHNKAQVR